LQRWGIAFRDVVRHETLTPPWRDVLVALRRMEARGEIRGGRFVATIVGEQFALPDALDALRAARRNGSDDALCEVSNYDPLRVVNIFLPERAAIPLAIALK
jgi:ATP-dependent helicase Lhr and Lhr-like helicase